MPDKLMRLTHDQIVPAGDNVRANVGDTSELMASIVAFGVLEPLRAQKESGSYRLIAGERRWTAVGQAIEAGELPADFEIPVVVQAQADDDDRTAMMLIENMQRSDLSVIDEASGFRALIELYGWKRDDLATRLGLSKKLIADRLSLLKLPEDVQQRLVDGDLNIGLAVDLCTLPQEKVDAVCKSGLSPYNVNAAIGQHKKELALQRQITKLTKEGYVVCSADELKAALETDVSERTDQQMLIHQLHQSLKTPRAKRVSSWSNQDEILDYADKVFGRNHILVYGIQHGMITWDHMVDEEAEPEQEEMDLSDLDKLLDQYADEYNEARAEYQDLVAGLERTFIADAKPGELMKQAALYTIERNIRGRAYVDKVGRLLGMEDANEENVMAYAKANSSNMARALFASCMVGWPKIETGIEYPPEPEMKEVPNPEDYDEEGNYIHPSEGEAA